MLGKIFIGSGGVSVIDFLNVELWIIIAFVVHKLQKSDFHHFMSNVIENDFVLSEIPLFYRSNHN